MGMPTVPASRSAKKDPKVARVRKEPDREPRTQYAALPWRLRADGEIEVLLITSRETQRWVIPKGWPIKTLSPGASAAHEAFEEAGVSGKVRERSIGRYHYDKRLRSGRLQHVRVLVYALQVVALAEEWPEKGQRELKWVPPADGAEMVAEPELKTLLAAYKG